MNVKAARAYRQMARARAHAKTAAPDPATPGDRPDRRAVVHTVHVPRAVKAIYARIANGRLKGRQRARWRGLAPVQPRTARGYPRYFNVEISPDGSMRVLGEAP